MTKKDDDKLLGIILLVCLAAVVGFSTIAVAVEQWQKPRVQAAQLARTSKLIYITGRSSYPNQNGGLSYLLRYTVDAMPVGEYFETEQELNDFIAHLKVVGKVVNED